MSRRHRGPAVFDDRGQMAGIEVLPFGFLVFVAGALVLANAWAVVDAKFAATAAAREAIRVYVESPGALDAHLAASDAARASVAAHGRDPADVTLTLDVGSGFGRCHLVTAEVALEVDSVTVPFVGGFGRLFDVRASHSEIVDPYRSGLPGRALCDG